MLRLDHIFIHDVHGIPYPGASRILVREILDTYGDGLADALELARGTDPTLADSDNYGLDDKTELEYCITPLDSTDPGKPRQQSPHRKNPTCSGGLPGLSLRRRSQGFIAILKRAPVENLFFHGSQIFL